jgi:hypothetical protein
MKFFHRIATTNFRTNYVASLCTADGRIVCDHDAKVAVIWQAFKERIGCSDYPQMQFDLSTL